MAPHLVAQEAIDAIGWNAANVVTRVEILEFDAKISICKIGSDAISQIYANVLMQHVARGIASHTGAFEQMLASTLGDHDNGMGALAACVVPGSPENQSPRPTEMGFQVSG